MPITKSAQRRMRSNERKQQRNKVVKSRLKTLEKTFLGLLEEDEKDSAAAALKDVTSKLDKAAKSGVIHKMKANRKKSRLAIKLHRAVKPATAETTAVEA